MAWREYTLPRNDEASAPKGWIQGNTTIGTVLEVTTSHLQGKHGVENRIESVNKDISHSWVRVVRGLKKLVTNLSNNEQDDNEQETSVMQFEDSAMKTNVLTFCKPIKGQSKTTKTRTCQLGHGNYTHWGKELGLILNHKNTRSPTTQC